LLPLLDPDNTYLKPPKMSMQDRFHQDYRKRAQRIKPPQANQNPSKIESYTPLHPELFNLCEEFFVPSFLGAVKSGNESNMRNILEEVAPHVYAFQMFTPDFCRQMIEEIENFEKSGLDITRPNSMNRYGAVLDEVGFEKMMDVLMHNYISPFARFLFPDNGGDSLTERRAFVVHYKKGGDINLKSHVDSSSVTLNVCLGRDFSGGNLVFQGIKGTPQENTEHIEYTHVLGKGLLHLGKHIHQANDILSGERYNLIIWCRRNLCDKVEAQSL